MEGLRQPEYRGAQGSLSASLPGSQQSYIHPVGRDNGTCGSERSGMSRGLLVPLGVQHVPAHVALCSQTWTPSYYVGLCAGSSVLCL